MSGGGAELRGIPFVVSGPSGVGKSTLLRRVLERDERLRFSVSHTTRPPRAGETDGRDYWFVDEARFRGMIDADAFLEWAGYQGRLYGTSRAAVEEPTRAGLDLILEVEVQGARQLRERLVDACYVFVLPPASIAELEKRLRGRRSDDDQAIAKRLETARQEVLEARLYDYAVINEDLDRAVGDLLAVIRAERLRSSRVLPQWRARFAAD